MDKADIGNWSRNRRKIIAQVYEEQARSVRLGHTEEVEDSLTPSQYLALFVHKLSGLSAFVAFGNEETAQRECKRVGLEIAALSLSMLESIARKEAQDVEEQRECDSELGRPG